MNTTRFIFGAACALLPLLAPHAHAQEWPSKPVRLVASFSTGAFQILAHILSENLAPVLGQPVVVDYRTGAGGNLGPELVVKAPPDGHTLVMFTSTHAVAPLLNRKLNYDMRKSFELISFIATVPNLLVVHPSLPAKTLKELAHLARTNPGKLTYGSGGTGTLTHLTNELFRTHAKAEIVHVPYKGGSLALMNILTGEVDMSVTAVPGALPYITSGRVRPLAVLSTERVATLPNVPTAAQAGMPELVSVAWYGVGAPSGTRPEIVMRLSSEIARIMKNPDVRQRLAKVGIDPVVSTPKDFQDFVRTEVAKWSQVIREAKIQID
jgi:tripartite-type tricarboxylate transporter receptor subunit TctC